MNNSRVVFLDWVRVIACFMVMLVHCIEPFYLGGPEGTYIASKTDALWVTLVNSALRSAVPLFVLTSSYLLFPLKTDTTTFFRKRFGRVVVPFVVWSLLYCVIPPLGSQGIDIAANFKNLAFNFTVTLGDETIDGTYGEMTFTDGIATFTLKDGETKSATGIPSGISYEVTEEPNDLLQIHCLLK